MKKQNNHSLDIGKGLALLSQLAISILTPLLLFVFGARYLTQRFGIGEWLIPIAIIIGILVGLMSAWNIVQATLIQQKKIQEKRDKESGTEIIKEARERMTQASTEDKNADTKDIKAVHAADNKEDNIQ